jgi:NAD(P)-dependent dehydrogenase (short-subunit alcohol dehydrogenase family)
LKTILITGSGEGIGLSCLKKFEDNNWNVIPHYFKFEKEFKEMKSFKNRINCDFTNQKKFYNFLKKISKMKIDAVINCAGIFDNSKEKKNRIIDIQKTLLVNTIVPVLITETLLDSMIKNQFGRVVNISSVGVKYGSNENNLFYSISKAGLEISTKSFVRKCAKHNILINNVRPGPTPTKFLLRTAKNLEKRKEMIPAKRFCKTEEISELIFYLINKNTFVTNENISIAGGE